MFFDSTSLLLVGSAVFLTYYKGDVAKASRGFGYHVGRAVGFALHMRAKFLTNAPLWDLHKTLAQSVLELHTVGQDIRQATTTSSRVVVPAVVASSPAYTQVTRPPLDHTPSPSTSAPFSALPLHVTQPAAGTGFAAAGAASQQPTTTSAPPSSPLQDLISQQPPSNFIDITAADLRAASGAAPQGSSFVTGPPPGSLILTRALEEEEVARNAVRFSQAMAGGAAGKLGKFSE